VPDEHDGVNDPDPTISATGREARRSATPVPSLRDNSQTRDRVASFRVGDPVRHGGGSSRFAGRIERGTTVDVRIGVTQAPRELTVEMPDDERDETVATIEAAMSGQSEVLWLIDKRGRRVGVPSAKIAYVEVGTSDGDRRIGFGG
jgi:hypothetical protein